MQKIIVRNFGPIVEAEIEIKGLTILIGEQASGKSTLAKLIYFFKTIKKDIYNLARYESVSFDDPNNDLELIGKVIENFKTKFKKYFGAVSNLPNDYFIEFRFSDINYIRIAPVPGNRLNIAFEDATFYQIIRSLRNNTPAISRLNLTNDFDGLRFYENRLNEDLDRLFSDNFEPLFVPAGRNITVSYPQEFKDFFLAGLSSSGLVGRSASDAFWTAWAARSPTSMCRATARITSRLRGMAAMARQRATAASCSTSIFPIARPSRASSSLRISRGTGSTTSS